MRKDSQGRPRRRRLRFHLFEKLRRGHHHVVDISATGPRDAEFKGMNDATAAVVDPSYSQNVAGEDTGYAQRELSMHEALALLEGREYVREKPNIWLRLSNIEKHFRSPLSIYAFKVAAAAMVFGALIWADGTRKWFLSYTIASSMLTLVVAL
jgi:hypothetical protein